MAMAACEAKASRNFISVFEKFPPPILFNTCTTPIVWFRTFNGTHMTDLVMNMVCSSTRRAKREIPVTLDSRYQLNSYKNAGITSATPHEAEMEAFAPVVAALPVAVALPVVVAPAALDRVEVLLRVFRHGPAKRTPAPSATTGAIRAICTC